MECLVMVRGEQERHLDPVLMKLADRLIGTALIQAQRYPG
jgi:hypothetical protein